MPYQYLEDTTNLVTLTIVLVLLVLIDLLLFKILKKIYFFTCIPFQIGCVCAWLFTGLSFLTVFLLLVSFIIILFFFFVSPNVAYLAQQLSSKRSSKSKLRNIFSKKNEGEVLFDREAVYEEIAKAVFKMSKEKCGALITIEKKMPLDDVIRQGNGVLLNSPVKAELLETIFYEGTRLHDGAVIIRNDTILAASVFFEPSTRPLSGKYGSRHRAAIGIAEVSDSVTIVVSEETGRISLAYDTELHPLIDPDDFLNQLEAAMSIDLHNDGE